MLQLYDMEVAWSLDLGIRKPRFAVQLAKGKENGGNEGEGEDGTGGHGYREMMHGIKGGYSCHVLEYGPRQGHHQHWEAFDAGRHVWLLYMLYISGKSMSSKK
jgi:hypothetical protein